MLLKNTTALVLHIYLHQMRYFITVLTSNRKVHWYTKFQKNHICYYLNFRHFANAFKYNW